MAAKFLPRPSCSRSGFVLVFGFASIRVKFAANYAALPGCFAGWVEAFPAVILICLGLDSSRLAMLILSTPSLNSAFTLSGLTVLGRVKERTNFPYWRSIR